MMQIPIKVLRPGAQLPVYSSEQAAGADLHAWLEAPLTIEPGETAMIPTGLAIALPVGYAGLLYARSGLAARRGLAPANKVGVIDPDYRGELIVTLHNHGREAQTIQPGERVAQLVVTPYLTCDFVPTDTLDETARGEGGYGSTGRV